MYVIKKSLPFSVEYTWDDGGSVWDYLTCNVITKLLPFPEEYIGDDGGPLWDYLRLGCKSL